VLSIGGCFDVKERDMVDFREIEMSRAMIIQLTKNIDEIELMDGKHGFNRSEFKFAKNLLIRWNVVTKPKFFTKESLNPFLYQLRVTRYYLSEKEYKECYDVSAFETQCDVFVEAARLTIAETERGFASSIRVFRDKIMVTTSERDPTPAPRKRGRRVCGQGLSRFPCPSTEHSLFR